MTRSTLKDHNKSFRVLRETDEILKHVPDLMTSLPDLITSLQGLKPWSCLFLAVITTSKWVFVSTHMPYISEDDKIWWCTGIVVSTFPGYSQYPGYACDRRVSVERLCMGEIIPTFTIWRQTTCIYNPKHVNRKVHLIKPFKKTDHINLPSKEISLTSLKKMNKLFTFLHGIFWTLSWPKI